MMSLLQSSALVGCRHIPPSRLQQVLQTTMALSCAPSGSARPCLTATRRCSDGLSTGGTRGSGGKDTTPLRRWVLCFATSIDWLADRCNFAYLPWHVYASLVEGSRSRANGCVETRRCRGGFLGNTRQAMSNAGEPRELVGNHASQAALELPEMGESHRPTRCRWPGPVVGPWQLMGVVPITRTPPSKRLLDDLVVNPGLSCSAITHLGHEPPGSAASTYMLRLGYSERSSRVK